MSTSAAIPGLRFTAVRRPPEPSPLRSDVAGFIGRTRRGPVARLLRVEGWREYTRMFGGLDTSCDTPYAVRGYFENDGEVAWVVRVSGAPSCEAAAVWKAGEIQSSGQTWDPARGGFPAAQFRILATSPGRWAKGTVVSIHYWREGSSGKPSVDFVILAPGEPPEYIVGLNPAALGDPDAVPSALIRVERDGPPLAGVPLTPPSGPRALTWEVTLDGGETGAPGRDEYRAAGVMLNDQPEVALVSTPDLSRDLKDDGDRKEILGEYIDRADALRDRLVLLDAPCDQEKARDVIQWVESLRSRASAIYHPRLRVPDPLGTLASPLRKIPASGHVAGVISRLDRERGAHHTPANAEVHEAVDVSRAFDNEDQGYLNVQGVNLVRCAPGRGLVVWGGRTLDPDPAGLYVAHRRLIHRLVRAIRRVAQPLVFDINGPELWLAFVRAITTVLLEAWRSGGLKGSRPEEAFSVQCDERNNPPEERDLGRVLCLVMLAPAAPMEFIELRVALSADGVLEVFES